MAWNYTNNFPTDIDAFTPPIDYPAVGWQKIISLWWQGIVSGILSVQQYTLHQLGVDRGDPAVVDFDLTDLVTDGNPHDLDFSAWIGSYKTFLLFHLILTLGAGGGGISFRTKGNDNWHNCASAGGGPGSTDIPFDLIVAPNDSGIVEYKADNAPWTRIDITIRSVSK